MPLTQAGVFWNFTLKAHLELSLFECTQEFHLPFQINTSQPLTFFIYRKVIMRRFFLHLEVFLYYFAPLGALQLLYLITEGSSWCSAYMQSKNKQTKAVWVHHHISYKLVRKNREVAHLFHYIRKPRIKERSRKVKILQILSCKFGSKRGSVAEKTTEVAVLTTAAMLSQWYWTILDTRTMAILWPHRMAKRHSAVINKFAYSYNGSPLYF